MLKNLINNKNIPNDGKEFIGVNLDGWRMRAENKQELNKPIGDGIILVKQPQTVVSDIIIDDEEVAIIRMYSLRNNIQGEFAQSGMDYKGCDGHCNPFKYTAWSTYPMDNAHFAVSGGEIKWAKWIPKINVAGQYEIFVWYPNEFDNRFINFKISDLSSNVKYKIKDSKGETIKEINQQIDGGQWNSLGVYNFNVGTSGYIV